MNTSTREISRSFASVLALGACLGLAACSSDGPLPESATLTPLNAKCQGLPVAGPFDGLQEGLGRFFLPGGFPVPEGASAIVRTGLALIRVTETVDALLAALRPGDGAAALSQLGDSLRCALVEANRALILLNADLGRTAVGIGGSLLPGSEPLTRQLERVLLALNRLLVPLDDALQPKSMDASKQALEKLGGELAQLAEDLEAFAASAGQQAHLQEEGLVFALLGDQVGALAALLGAATGNDSASGIIAVDTAMNRSRARIDAFIARAGDTRGWSRLMDLLALPQGLLDALLTPLDGLLNALLRGLVKPE